MTAILGRPGVRGGDAPGGAEACRFEGPNHTEVVIGLRSGDEIAPFWKLALDANHGAMVPLAGAGDTALRARDGAEVIARKGSLSCQANVAGLDEALTRATLKASGEALARRLGALCAKVFAKRRA
ncbi:MAG: hypothetical protein ACR2F8_02280 [Caulobacteraceae bacterium]